MPQVNAIKFRHISSMYFATHSCKYFDIYLHSRQEEELKDNIRKLETDLAIREKELEILRDRCSLPCNQCSLTSEQQEEVRKTQAVGICHLQAIGTNVVIFTTVKLAGQPDGLTI